MMSRTVRHMLVGAGVWLAVGLVAYYAFASGGLARRGDFQVSAVFDQVDGLSAGAPVYLAGIKIGEVTRMEVNAKTFRPTVTFGIRAGVRLPTDSGVLIMSDGLLGGKFVRIEPGSDDTYMKTGDRFQFIQDAVVVEQLLERIVVTAEARRRSAQTPREKTPNGKSPNGKSPNGKSHSGKSPSGPGPDVPTPPAPTEKKER